MLGDEAAAEAVKGTLNLVRVVAVAEEEGGEIAEVVAVAAVLHKVIKEAIVELVGTDDSLGLLVAGEEFWGDGGVADVAEGGGEVGGGVRGDGLDAVADEGLGDAAVDWRGP